MKKLCLFFSGISLCFFFGGGESSTYLHPFNPFPPLPVFHTVTQSEGTSFPTPHQLVRSVVRKYNPKLFFTTRTKPLCSSVLLLDSQRSQVPGFSFPSLAERFVTGRFPKLLRQLTLFLCRVSIRSFST